MSAIKRWKTESMNSVFDFRDSAFSMVEKLMIASRHSFPIT